MQCENTCSVGCKDAPLPDSESILSIGDSRQVSTSGRKETSCHRTREPDAQQYDDIQGRPIDGKVRKRSILDTQLDESQRHTGK